MNISWKLKSKMFSLIDTFDVPSALYFLQKHVTRRSRITELSIGGNWVRHKESLLKYGCKEFVFEFGGGKSLAQNLFLSDAIDRQLVVDLNHMIDLELVNKAKALLVSQTTLKSSKDISSVDDLKSYGITYKSPYDASRTDLDDKSLDACVSTNTLEHIPVESIRKIFLELSRTLKDTGIVSAKIDYSDHYAHTDSSISLLNYLYYSDAEWQKYNHSCHYQNRLRHNDYKQIFGACGFSVIEEELHYGEGNIPLDLIEKFRGEDESWSATSAYFVLRKGNASQLFSF